MLGEHSQILFIVSGKEEDGLQEGMRRVENIWNSHKWIMESMWIIRQPWFVMEQVYNFLSLSLMYGWKVQRSRLWGWSSKGTFYQDAIQWPKNVQGWEHIISILFPTQWRFTTMRTQCHLEQEKRPEWGFGKAWGLAPPFWWWEDLYPYKILRLYFVTTRKALSSH